MPSFSVKTFNKEKKTISGKNLIPYFLIAFLVFSVYSSIPTPFFTANAHFDRFASYNSSGMGIGDKYYVLQQLEPEYVKPNEPSKIMFSIQDKHGKDVYDVTVTVEIYSINGERVLVFPWTTLETGDFTIPFVFTKNGNYQIVLSILNEDISSSKILDTVPPPRTILNDSLNCNCERAVFNVSITETFGLISTLAMYGTIIGVVIVLGIVLIWIFVSRRKNKSNPI
ncbi:MAG: hypothetical protein L0H53_02635 [Candidatus Nitrosocosmicus sp.]|nr:hypothetical protein [Candidatus Nitrosocosmicus sp.]MDN5867130.1 hypothetical protein [Candidatus Nitrosocosmicus sp.]